MEASLHPVVAWSSGERDSMIVLAHVFQPETLMYRLVRALALAAVLVHITFGCCVHHAHAESVLGDGECAAGAGGCGEEHGDDHDRACPHRQEPSRGCCDRQPCSFVRPEVGGVLGVSIERHLLSVAASLTGTAGAASRSTIDAIDLRRVVRSEPVRLHLLNQVLLV